MKRIITFCLCFTGMIPMLASANNTGESLPSFSGETLTEKPVSLPEQSPSKFTLYIFAYQREHQTLVDEVLESAEPLFQAYAPHLIDYIEVPTVENYGMLFRAYLDGVMRSGIPEDYKRERIVTYYTDMEQFQERYGIDNVDTITSMLVSRDGTIHWQHVGPISTDASNRLTRTATKLLQKNTGNQNTSAL